MKSFGAYWADGLILPEEKFEIYSTGWKKRKAKARFLQKSGMISSFNILIIVKR